MDAFDYANGYRAYPNDQFDAVGYHWHNDEHADAHRDHDVYTIRDLDCIVDTFTDTLLDAIGYIYTLVYQYSNSHTVHHPVSD